MEHTLAQLMDAAERGDRTAAETLFAALYADLHRLARRELSRHGAQSLSPTTLLHEAYLSMAGKIGPEFPDRARFMGYAARVMRSVIIDHARRRQAIKRGGNFELTTLDTEAADQCADDRQLAGIGDALDELAKTEPELAEIVDLKYFCGLSLDEIAALRGVSKRTVQRTWEKARALLYQSLRSDLD